MNRLALLLVLLLTMIPNRAWAQLQKFRAANGGFGTAINAILPGAYHAKIFQKYGLDAEYIALEKWNDWDANASRERTAGGLHYRRTRGHGQSPGRRLHDYRRRH
jgi:hypothetical protein